MEFASNVNFNNNKEQIVMNAPDTKINVWRVHKTRWITPTMGTKMDCENTTDKASSEK
jgi:hypothetical protein